MQNLGVISVNLWQILVSLLNLVLMFLILKRFLWKPVKRIYEERRSAVDGAYRDAESARRDAEEKQAEYTERLKAAEREAESIVSRAALDARTRADDIVADAKTRADGILRKAEEDASLARKKAKEGIRQEVVIVSTALAEQMLKREINAEDHKELFDDFLAKVGEGNDEPR